MKVIGNVSPNPVSVEQNLANNLVEIRLRENVRKISEEGLKSDEQIEMYQYDEYVLHIPNREGLKEDIESDLQDWLMTGRKLEYNPIASAVKDLEHENAVYASNIAELDASYREGVNSV